MCVCVCMCVCVWVSEWVRETETETDRERQRHRERDSVQITLKLFVRFCLKRKQVSIYDVIGTCAAAILDCWQIARLRDAWSFQLVWKLCRRFSAPFAAETVWTCPQEQKTSWKDLSCILVDLGPNQGHMFHVSRDNIMSWFVCMPVSKPRNLNNG